MLTTHFEAVLAIKRDGACVVLPDTKPDTPAGLFVREVEASCHQLMRQAATVVAGVDIESLDLQLIGPGEVHLGVGDDGIALLHQEDRCGRPAQLGLLKYGSVRSAAICIHLRRIVLFGECFSKHALGNLGQPCSVQMVGYFNFHSRSRVCSGRTPIWSFIPMKKTTVLLLCTGLALGACSKDTTTAPLDDTTSILLDEAATLAYNASFAANPGDNLLPGIHRLPDNLKLTADQQARIKALMTAFADATKADREALAAIDRQAKEARKAGKTQAEVEAILRTGDAIRQRLSAAEAKLKADLDAVLTAEQKAWLNSNKAPTCPSLTDAQRTQIAALIAAYEQANKADLDAVKAALDNAKAAREAHATKDQIVAILNAVKPNLDRLKAASDKLRADIEALLTPEQKNARCVKLPEPPNMPGPSRGPKG